MTEKMKNNDGFTFIGVMVLLFITMSFSSMLITSTQFFSKNQYAIREDRNIKEVVSNTILHVYTVDDWESMPAKEDIDTNSGVVSIDYQYIKKKSNEELNISFTHNEKERNYTLKRGGLR